MSSDNEVLECHACGMPTDELRLCKPQLGSKLHRVSPDEKVGMCEVCYRTHYGSMWEFGEQYLNALPVARIVVQCTRLVLSAIGEVRDELRALRKELKR